MKLDKEKLKAFVGAVCTILVALVSLLADETVRSVLPQAWQVWLVGGGGLAALSAITYKLVSLTRNVMTVEQVLTAIDKGDFTADELREAAAPTPQ